MDALIELIVWIFKAVFGEQTKPPENEYRGTPRTPPKRGPYNYGDESGARRPKTLEEILEEVRREASQKKGVVQPRASQPPQKQPAAAPAAKAAVARSEPRTFRAPLESEQSLSQPLSTVTPEAGRAVLGQLERAPTLATLPQMTRQARQPGEPAYIPPMAEQISPQEAAATLAATAANPQAISTVREMQAHLTQQPAAIQTPALAFVKALRTASPQGRREAAWQAIVLAEIFGPPRSRRMGRRLI